MTRGGASIRFSACRTPIPSIPGMRRSSKIRSGLSCWIIARASSPLAAEPITSRPVWALSILVKPEQTTGWSSTIRIRIKLLFCFDMRDTLRYVHPFPFEQGGQVEARRYRGCHLNPSALTRLTKDFELSIDGGCASAHTAQPKTKQSAALHETDAIVTNSEPHYILLPPQGNLQMTGVSMTN